MSKLSLGFSPCPNDTFMFHDLVHGLTDAQAADPALQFDYELHDIEALNHLAQQDPPRFDLTKLSIPALAGQLTHYTLLDAGAALGRACGPLVVARPGTDQPDSLAALTGRRVAIPGHLTTAFLLLRMFGPVKMVPVVLRFDQIMPAVARGDVAAGLIIHESRFTFADHDLVELADLGELWERKTELPLPLGIIAARSSLGPERIATLELALRQSIQNAFDVPSRSAAWVTEHAQEMDAEVCRRHIELYVNEFSLGLGDQGRSAIARALEASRGATDQELDR